MLSLFNQGGLLCMAILTLLLIVILAMAVYKVLQISNRKVEHSTSFRYQLSYIKSVGLIALVFGIFSQLLGLYQMFAVLEAAGGIAPAILAGGLKVSMIPMVYGLIIFLISYVAWLALDYMFERKENLKG